MLFKKKKTEPAPTPMDIIISTRSKFCKMNDRALMSKARSDARYKAAYDEMVAECKKANSEAKRASVIKRMQPKLHRYKAAAASSEKLIDYCEMALDFLRDKKEAIDDGEDLSLASIATEFKGFMESFNVSAKSANLDPQDSLGTTESGELRRDIDSMFTDAFGYDAHGVDQAIADEVQADISAIMAGCVVETAKETDDEIDKLIRSLQDSTEA